MNFVLEHLSYPKNKQIKPFFHWISLQGSSLDLFIRSLFNEIMEKGQKGQIEPTLASWETVIFDKIRDKKKKTFYDLRTAKKWFKTKILQI